MKQRHQWMLGGALLLALVACGTPQPPSAAAPSPVPAQQAEQSPARVAEAPSPAIQDEPTGQGEAAATNPLCNLATFPEVQAAVGGKISKIDVIDEATMSNLSCVYLDQQDYNNGMNIQFIATDRLVKTDSQWSTAAAYFAEWTRKGDPVAGLGDGAAWVELPSGLFVLKGDTVMQLSASSANTKDPAVRTKFEALAKQVVSRLP